MNRRAPNHEERKHNPCHIAVSAHQCALPANQHIRCAHDAVVERKHPFETGNSNKREDQADRKDARSSKVPHVLRSTRSCEHAKPKLQLNLFNCSTGNLKHRRRARARSGRQHQREQEQSPYHYHHSHLM